MFTYYIRRLLRAGARDSGPTPAGDPVDSTERLTRRETPLGEADQSLLAGNGTWSRRDTLECNRLSDSGGSLLLLSPGVQFISWVNFLVEATYQLPVWQDLNGAQLGFDPTFKVGLRWLLS